MGVLDNIWENCVMTLRKMPILLQFLIVLSLAILCTSCATSSKQVEKEADKDNVSVQAVKNRFVLGVQTKNVDELMSLLTEDFTHNHFGDRETLRMILSEAVRMGFMDDVNVNLRNTQDSLQENGNAMIGPIELEGVFGYLNFTLYFKEVEDKWYINKIVTDV
jgi:hypothetical protein